MDSREDFLLAMAEAVAEDKLWAFMVRGVIINYSDKLLDFVELAEVELRGRDVIKCPFYNLSSREIIEKNTNKYKIIFNGSITNIPKKAIVIPHQLGDYRFTIIEPVYEDQRHLLTAIL
jgi:hypothetical protein